jgi:aminocarboxymuconate-semialdehyde decarboxylase
MTAIAIDMHAHYYGGLVDDMLKRDVRPFVSRDQRGRLFLNAMTATTEMAAGYTDIPARIRWMDERRIATQLMTFPGSLGVDVLPIAEALQPVRSFNEHLAATCADSGGLLVGLAGLPLADMALAREEILRVRRELKLAGAILPGNYFLSIEDARKLTPVFEAANETGALFMIHPGVMPGEAAPAPYADTSVYRASALNLQASLSHMALTIVTERLAETYPKVTFQVVNLGGTIPFVLERLEAIAASRPPFEPFPRERFRGLVYDCASLGPRALELAVSVFGADRVMLGTDYPIFSVDQVNETVEASRLSDADKRMVLSGTAERVLDRVLA